jgi:hypothetical protein
LAENNKRFWDRDFAMNKKQKENYNNMLRALKMIHNEYMSPSKIQKVYENYGCEYVEALEMSYENIQQVAKNASKNLRFLK